MNLDKSNWKFDGSVVPVFDEHVRQSVPMYDEIHRQIAEMSAWFLEEGTNVYDIGSSTGEVIKNLKSSYPDKNIEIIGIDNSPEMTEKAIGTFKKEDNVRFELVDLTKEEYEIKNASLITSVLTAQFIPPRFRQELINKVYSGLKKM